jgi:M6 family metalloprotease-like protein
VKKFINTPVLRNSLAFLFLSFVLFIQFTSITNAAYLKYVPQTLQQPDGTVIHCFASGDEYYNWLHDKDGYTIIQSPTTGYYSYAQEINGELVPTDFIVGKANPSTLVIKKWLKISQDKIYERVHEYQKYLQKPGSKNKSDRIQIAHTGTINNIVIFIRFSDESEFTDPISTYDNLFNTTPSSSLKSYYLEASYNAVTISSTFYPTPGATVLSYQDSHVRNYYEPYNSVTNPIGYTSDETTREHTLLKNAVNAVKSQIPPGLNVDSDGDGYVDNVCFIIYGSPGAWSDLLWPHMWTLSSYTVYINSKRVWNYNFQLQTVVDVGVLCHEMFHTFGAPDLYHYSYDGLNPVGNWDLMENDLNPPEHMGSYMKFKYGQWISSISQITTSGTYYLNPLTSSTTNCYRINSPNSTTEYFVLEYRKKIGTFESSIPGSGLLVYRINTLAGNGNANGPPDEVYIYRLNGTKTVNGSINSAYFSLESGRTQINDNTNPSSFLSDGSSGNLKVYDISSSGASTITFKVSFGAIPPQLKIPFDMSDRLTLTPFITWFIAVDAVSYDLQVSSVSDFSSTDINEMNMTDTTYLVTRQLAHGTWYYWRVRAHTASETSAWSDVWRFRTYLDSPTLVAPANNLTSIDTLTALIWSPVTGADSYNVQLSTTSNFSVLIKNDTNIFSTSYSASGLKFGTKYYWHVSATNTGGASDWSSNWNFSTKLGAPTIPNPANNAKAVPDSGILRWNSVSMATQYTIQLSRMPDFSTFVFNQLVPDTIFGYSGLEFGTMYFWRVNASNHNETSVWSNDWDFTTLLGAPVLVNPANHAYGIADTGSFSWQHVNSSQSYDLQVSTDSTFVIKKIDTTGILKVTQSYTGLNFNTKYYWRVRAHDTQGSGKWSEVRDFVTQLAPPDLISPNNNDVVSPDSGSLQWTAVPDAQSYKVLLSTSQDFATTVINDSVNSYTSYPLPGLTKDRTYYWKVKASSNINSGKWSDVWSFTTQFDAPALQYPADNSSGIPVDLQFLWLSLTGASIYNIVVSSSQDFNTTIINDTVSSGNAYSFSGLNFNTKYYWHIRAKKNGAWSAWSIAWSFTTTISSPLLSSPNNKGNWAPVVGTLNWVTVPGALSYNVQLSKFQDLNPPIVNDTGVSATSYDYSGLEYNTKYFWRVLGKNTQVTSDWSDVWNFTTRIAPPVLVSPSDNAVKIQNYSFILWNPIASATSYNVQLSKTSDFSADTIDGTGITATFYNIGRLELNTDYHWHVNAVTAAGTTDWSDAWKFTTNLFSNVSGQLSGNVLSFMNYPNPVSEGGTIELSLGSNSIVRIELYNLLGERVNTLFSGFANEGTTQIKWTAVNLPSGVYYIELISGSEIQRLNIIVTR